MMKPHCTFLIIIFILFNCNRDNTKPLNNENDCVVLQSLDAGKYSNEKYISLIKKRFTQNNKKEEKYILKDYFKEYEINSYFSKFNTKRTSKNRELSLKQCFNCTDNSLKKQNIIFVLQFINSDYCSYTFFEYKKDILYVSYFFEKIFVDESGFPTQDPLANKNILYAFSINKIDVRADVFFSKSFIFDSINKKEEKYNYLNKREEWLNKPKTQQEEWVIKHIFIDD